MWNWENKLVGETLYYSRIIASYYKALRKAKHVYYRGEFEDWLRSLGILTEEEINEICCMADNGKLELESHAYQYVQNLKKQEHLR